MRAQAVLFLVVFSTIAQADSKSDLMRPVMEGWHDCVIEQGKMAMPVMRTVDAAMDFALSMCLEHEHAVARVLMLGEDPRVGILVPAAIQKWRDRMREGYGKLISRQ